MSDDMDDLLTDEGERWRAGLGTDPDIAALLPPRRPRRRAAAALATAVVAVAVAALVIMINHRGISTSGGEASCVAPILSVEEHAAPAEPGHHPSLGTVTRGHDVTVYGRQYFSGPCLDVEQSGQAIPPAAAAASVSLTLTTSDHQTRTLATVHPDSDAAFTATLAIPADAPPGPATIADGHGHLIDLTIVAQ